MLKVSLVEKLKSTKNLLAFSGGGDSTALFFLLLEHNLAFDIAIVNYKQREQSKEEVAYAQSLAKQNNLECFVYDAPQISSNFESNARKIRYAFFEELIEQHHYQTLLTAHHLGDRFEWMLMQFCKGAGCPELLGMQVYDQREKYTLTRPLLHLDKSELLEYLHKHKILFFEDESNSDEKYHRNYFRKNHTHPLLQKHLNGIKKSFEYMDADKKNFIKDTEIHVFKKWVYFKSTQHKRSDIFHIDKYLKRKGYLLSAEDKKLLEEKESVIISRKLIVSQTSGLVFIMPYLQNIIMSKEFKESMRKLKVAPKLRAYLFTNQEARKIITSLL